MVKQMDKKTKGTGLYANVAVQNGSLAMPVPFMTACAPLLTVFFDERISFLYAHGCIEV